MAIRKNADGSISVGMLNDEKKTVEPVSKTGSVESEKLKRKKKQSN